MRLAVISDTHFGDELCTLACSRDGPGEPEMGPAYPVFREAVGEVDYLVLLGDIFDFSVASYEKAYRYAKIFFQRIQQDRVARELVYVAGNHDFDIWHTVEHQVNVINQLEQGQLPRAFKRSVPGVIDDRRVDPEAKFLLPDVTPKPELHEDRAYYGNLFLDHITRSGRNKGPKLRFNFAYPNLYLVTDEGESVLLTHGHYFEAYWTLASEWAMRLAADDLPLELEGELNLREMVGINQPLNQLACTGIGQAQPLTQIVRAVQMEVSMGRTDRLARYLDRLRETLRRQRSVSLPARLARAYGFRLVERRFLRFLRGVEFTRYSKKFMSRRGVRKRFRDYYRASMNEVRRLGIEHGLDVPTPAKILFGHTHQPIPWGSRELVDRVDGRRLSLSNSGGWLYRTMNGARDFVGAEIVIYESGRGIRSESIRATDF